MSSNIKTNLKFVMGKDRIGKNLTKGQNNPDFSSTININTNSKIKEKPILKKAKKALNSSTSMNEKEQIGTHLSSSLKKNYKDTKESKEISQNKNFLNTMNSMSFAPNILRNENKIPNKTTNNNLEQTNKSSHNSRVKTPLDISLKVILRENSKENNYASNNSNRSSKNIINFEKGIEKVEKMKRHQKNISEIPPSFKNLAQITEHNTYHNQTTSNNFFENYNNKYNKTSSSNKNPFKNEVSERTSNLDPREIMVKTKSQAIFKTQREGSVNSLKRKELGKTSTTTGDEVEINTDDSHNRFSNVQCNHCNNGKQNLNNNLKQNALLAKCKELEKNQREYMTTIEILKSYVRANQSVAENKKVEIGEKFDKKCLEVKKLKEENEAIKKQNSQLKITLLKTLHQIKLYENLQTTRENELNTIFNQLMIENEYLRYASEFVIGKEKESAAAKDKQVDEGNVATIANSKEDGLNGDYSTTVPNIVTEGEMKTTSASNTHTYNSSEEKEEKIAKKQKAFHKRQKTHINFQHIQQLHINTSDTNPQTIENNTTGNNDSRNLSSISGNSLNLDLTFEETSKGDDDLFNSTLKEMNFNRTMRKIELSQQSINTNSNINQNSIPASVTSPANNSSQKSSKPVYLFYRTPSNKDNKKIEFKN